MEFKPFLKKIYNEYKNMQDKELLFILRLKYTLELNRNNNLNNIDNFSYLNNFLCYLEKNQNKDNNLKINDEEIEDYYNFYNIIITLPYINEKYNIDEINNLLNDDKINNIPDNQIILLNNKIFKLKYLKYMKNIILMLMKIQNHCLEYININKQLLKEENESNMYIINIHSYNSIIQESNNLINSLYNIMKTIINNI